MIFYFVKKKQNYANNIGVHKLHFFDLFFAHSDLVDLMFRGLAVSFLDREIAPSLGLVFLVGGFLRIVMVEYMMRSLSPVIQ